MAGPQDLQVTEQRRRPRAGGLGPGVTPKPRNPGARGVDTQIRVLFRGTRSDQRSSRPPGSRQDRGWVLRCSEVSTSHDVLLPRVHGAHTSAQSSGSSLRYALRPDPSRSTTPRDGQRWIPQSRAVTLWGRPSDFSPRPHGSAPRPRQSCCEDRNVSGGKDSEKPPGACRTLPPTTGFWWPLPTTSQAHASPKLRNATG